MKFDRIRVEIGEKGMTAYVRKLHVPVAVIAGMAADGVSEDELLERFPGLEPEDIREAVEYASEWAAHGSLHNSGCRYVGD